MFSDEALRSKEALAENRTPGNRGWGWGGREGLSLYLAPHYHQKKEDESEGGREEEEGRQQQKQAIVQCCTKSESALVPC